jgi:hypothetical protein
MVALQNLESRLNRDRQAYREFCEDPVAVLRGEGVPLDPMTAQSLRQALAQQQGSPRRIAGSSVGATAEKPVPVHCILLD